MEKIEVAVEKRTTRGKHNQSLRSEGLIPAVVYGRGIPSEPLQVELKQIERIYKVAGGNKILALKVADGKKRNVLIHDVQHHPTKGSMTHVDFYLVRMDEELKAEVPLHYVGESTAVYQNEGTLMKNIEVVEVECLPDDLPESLEVDISGLDDFEKTITLADISLPSGVKFVAEDMSVLVARVEPPRSDEEMAELDEDIAQVLPEGVAEENPVVVSEENEGDKDRRDKK